MSQNVKFKILNFIYFDIISTMKIIILSIALSKKLHAFSKAHGIIYYMMIIIIIFILYHYENFIFNSKHTLE